MYHYSLLLSALRALNRILIRRSTLRSATYNDTVLENRTTLALDKWLREKGYCEGDLTMEEVSERLGISREQLSAYSLETVGKSFLTWRKELRIREAQRLIWQNPKRSVRSVSAHVGVYDNSNFRKQFEEVAGFTFAEWKDRCTKWRAMRKILMRHGIYV